MRFVPLASGSRGNSTFVEFGRTRLLVDAALRSVWPGFYHRNLAPDVRAYFEATFPITVSDRRLLAHRYIDPILDDAL